DPGAVLAQLHPRQRRIEQRVQCQRHPKRHEHCHERPPAQGVDVLTGNTGQHHSSEQGQEHDNAEQWKSHAKLSFHVLPLPPGGERLGWWVLFYSNTRSMMTAPPTNVK